MYPNPYLINTAPKLGLLSRGLSSLKTIKWSSLLEGTQKTLGVINQAIPIVYQIKPIVNNAKTIYAIDNFINTYLKTVFPPCILRLPKTAHKNPTKIKCPQACRAAFQHSACGFFVC